MGGRQAEAGAVPDLLGREERVEDSGADLGRYARAVVGYVDPDAAGLAASADRDRPMIAERVDRVVDQVGADLVELRAAHGQLREVAVVVARNLDRGVLEPVREDGKRRLEPLVQV